MCECECDPLVLRGDIDFEVRLKTPRNHPKKRRVQTTLSSDLIILTNRYIQNSILSL